MITQQRLKIEKQVLDFGFPQRYVFHNIGTTNEWLELGLRTNAGKTYRLKVELSDFPHSKPTVYVIFPTPTNLCDFSGKFLKDYGVSATMHLLATDYEGNIQICHYSNKSWHENVTLYKVALKCLLWLNCYDGHLKTGKPIDHYLKHQ
jgi:hypothetical protein